MLDKRTIFEIHRLADEGYSLRQISSQLGINWRSVKKYLHHPTPSPHTSPKRASKLTPFIEQIEAWLKENPSLRATLIHQRLQEKGFEGQIGIVRQFVREKRGASSHREAFIRFESEPGEQFQIDWGHFGSLSYGQHSRKLYALCVIECYSRMLFVEFTHSQEQAALHGGLMNAFLYFGGTPKTIVVDNMLTAVTERWGSIIRFNESFLEFLRPFHITPHACRPRRPMEKGKIERSIGYLRTNFWPLRTFKDLEDVQCQVKQWLEATANQRVHQSTGVRPIERFHRKDLRSLPQLDVDCRLSRDVKVHKDFAVRFDGNFYSAPPWSIGKQITLKASQHYVHLYYKDKPIATHQRCWKRKERIETESHLKQVKSLKQEAWKNENVSYFASLDPRCGHYLQKMAENKVSLKKEVSRLLHLKEVYGLASLLIAINRALEFNAFGADYIQNILYQEMTPTLNYEPLRFKQEELNQIHLAEPSLLEYDALLLKKKGDL